MSRRVLYISYWVPPRNGIGSIRSAHLLNYLAEFGWHATTLTAAFDSQSSTVHGYIETRYVDVRGAVKRRLGMGTRTAHEAFKIDAPQHGANKTARQRLLSAASVMVRYPDEHVGWLPYALSAARRLIVNGKFDAVLSSGPPVTTNLIAALAHGGLPWIADMRDLWAENDSEDRNAVRKLLDDGFERFCLSKAAAVIASSHLSAKRFQQRYPGTRCYSISTGFEPQEWQGVPFTAEEQCTLFYAGTLYSGKRDPSVLFAALRAIVDEHLAAEDELRVDLYTQREPWLLELISRFGLEAIVRVRGFIDRRAVLAAERRANRLIVLSWDGPTAEGVVPGKLFEYFGARRRILAIGGPSESSVADLLRDTGAGVRARTVDDVKREVLNALFEHRAGAVRAVPETAVGLYTGRECARRFAGVLDQIVCADDASATRRRASAAAIAMPANTAK